MAGVIVVVLGVLAMINVAYCNSVLDIPCYRKPLQQFRLHCITDDEIVPSTDSVELDICILRKAQLLKDDNAIDVERLAMQIGSHVNVGREKDFSDYVYSVQKCARRMKKAASLTTAVQAWKRCEKNYAEDLLKKAICPA